MDPAESIATLASSLVAIPSRAGIDNYDAMAGTVAGWLADHGVTATIVRDGSARIVGVTARLDAGSGPTYLLAAPLDTAPFGAPSNWASSPIVPVVRDGWLHGRGSADSKAGIAIFCHVAAHVAALPSDQRGTASLELLFDADEHTGAFTGVQQYLAHRDAGRPLAGAFIGYPGNKEVRIGSRGFERAVVTVPGRAAHSGSSRDSGINAIVRAAAIVERLARTVADAPGTAAFPLTPKLTVTEIHGGEGFSQVPDWCEIGVDVRLTPSFERAQARDALARAANPAVPDGEPVTIRWISGWPPYVIPEDSPIVTALTHAAERVFGRPVPASIAGPGNIGNLLATHGVPAICGFGVTSREVHASDEAIEIATLLPVFRAYCDALAALGVGTSR